MTAMHMTTTTGEARDFLLAVEHELADLPVDERADLLEDLALHLAALEEDDGPSDLSNRLGTAEAYASELRAAAGLPPRQLEPSRYDFAHLGQQLRQDWHDVRVRWDALRERPAMKSAAVLASDLQRAWWVGRGLLIAFLLFALPELPDPDASSPLSAVPVQPELSLSLAQLLFRVFVVVFFVAVSSAVGRQGTPRTRPLTMVINGLILVTSLLVLTEVPLVDPT